MTSEIPHADLRAPNRRRADQAALIGSSSRIWRAIYFVVALLAMAAMLPTPSYAAEEYRISAAVIVMNGETSGSVTLNPPGPLFAPGTSVTATVNLASNAKFIKWSAQGTNCDNSTNPVCVFTVDFDGQGVRALIQEKDANETAKVLNVNAIGDGVVGQGYIPGRGFIKFSADDPAVIPAGIVGNFVGSETGNTSVTFRDGTTVTLFANFNADNTIFVGWGGACSGTATTCVVSLNADKQVTATFKKFDSYTLTLKKSGLGSGTLTSSPALLAYPPGTGVTVTATPAAGSKVIGWFTNGPQSDPDNKKFPICNDKPGNPPTFCQVVMDLNRTVTVEFSSDEPTDGKPLDGTSI